MSASAFLGCFEASQQQFLEMFQTIPATPENILAAKVFVLHTIYEL